MGGVTPPDMGGGMGNMYTLTMPRKLSLEDNYNDSQNNMVIYTCFLLCWRWCIELQFPLGDRRQLTIDGQRRLFTRFSFFISFFS
jgi:hypothetical protein